mgnify:CR=1 FL=1
MRTTCDSFAKSNRRQIAQWPIMGPWCTLWHRFNSHLGADLRAGGLVAMGRDSMCSMCCDGCAPPLGGQPPKHRPSPRPARPPQARAISPPRRTSSPPSIIGRLDHIFNHRSASAMGGSPAWRHWHAGTIQARAWFHRWHFYPPSLRLNSGIN